MLKNEVRYGKTVMAPEGRSPEGAMTVFPYLTEFFNKVIHSIIGTILYYTVLYCTVQYYII